MPDKLAFNLLPPSPDSEYRWLNIDRGMNRVGKVRGLIDENMLTIHSIVIFPEFEGKGYAKKTIAMLKSHFKRIVADRVRPNARGFWEKMDFVNNGDGSFVYKKG